MKISVAYADGRQVWLRLDVPEGCTLEQAVELSGIRKRCPEIDLTAQKVGIFGKPAKPDAVLRDGDRVEIYRPITADPETVPRRDMDDDD